jgi:hypothetical protein
MIHLSLDFIQTLNLAHFDRDSPDVEATIIPNYIWSAGFRTGTKSCPPSPWCTENAISHSDLREIDDEIMTWVPAEIGKQIERMKKDKGETKSPNFCTQVLVA